MSEIRVYECDVCKKGKQMGDLYTLALTLTGPLKPGMGQYRKSLSHNKHICISCLEKLGISMPVSASLTTDAQFLDILRDFIVETVEEN